MQAKLANTVQTAQAATFAAQHIAQALALEAVMAKTGSNPVAQILQHLGDFYEWRDYPEGGVWDRTTGYGYFYHAHPGSAFEDEHGHFHLFWAETREARVNLAALSMDRFGKPIGAFVPNRWHVEVADDSAITDRYAQFKIELAYPCFAANQWLSAAVRGLAVPMVKLHQRGLSVLADATVADDRGVPVLARDRIDFAARAAVSQRPSLKSVKR